MSTIKIIKGDITKIEADCIVNAANKYLGEGGGVCGAIFKAAGREKLAEACDAIGGCRTGDAIITPAFDIKNAKYIIHAVGPRYYEEIADKCERKLYGAYKHSLERMLENGCRSIAFPLISSGIFGYPVDEAWHVAFSACEDFFLAHRDLNIEVVIAVTNYVTFLEGELATYTAFRHFRHICWDPVRPKYVSRYEIKFGLHLPEVNSMSVDNPVFLDLIEEAIEKETPLTAYAIEQRVNEENTKHANDSLKWTLNV